MAVEANLAPDFERVNWSRALAMFKEARLQKDEDPRKLDEFTKERCTIQDAKDACARTQQRAGAEYSPALGGILDKIDIAMKVGDLAIKSAPESVGLAWMGIRLCLHSLADDFSTFGIFGAACSDIVGIMISCAVYGRMYGTPRGPECFQELHGQVIDRIPNIYKEILDFSYSVKKYMAQNKGIRIVKGLATQASTRFGGKIKSIRDHEAAMSEFARKAHEQMSDYYARSGEANQKAMMSSLSDIEEKMQQSLRLNQDCLSQIQRLMDERKAMKPKTALDLALEKFEDLKAKLNATSDQKSIFMTKLAKRSPPQTCTWIFDQADYKAWEESNGSSLLWVSGGGGYGKSVIMSAIVDQLSKSDHNLVQYFFCNASDDETTTVHITQHLIHQLYSLLEDWPLEVLQKANTIVSKFLKTRSGTASLGGIGRNTKSQGTNDAKSGASSDKDAIDFAEAYRSLVQLMARPAFVIIDALDECKDREKEGLISLFKSTVSEDTTANLKVILCSRPEPDIEMELSEKPRIKVEGNNGPDIRLNAADELAKMPGWSQAERNMACDQIVEKAGSLFRYVDLAVKFLKQPFQRPLQNRLQQLPEGLGAAYQQIVREMDPAYVELLRTCLTWVILADGEIKVSEIIDAYSRTYMVESPVSTNVEVSQDETLVVSDELHVQQVRTAGSALLEIDEKTRVVKVRHQTVAEHFKFRSEGPSTPEHTKYLCDNCQRESTSSKSLTISEKDGHMEMAITILRHLTCPAFRARYLKPFEKLDGNNVQKNDDTSTDNAQDQSATEPEGARQEDNSSATLKDGQAFTEGTLDQIGDKETATPPINGTDDNNTSIKNSMVMADPFVTEDMQKSENQIPQKEPPVETSTDGIATSENALPAETDDSEESDYDSDIESQDGHDGGRGGGSDDDTSLKFRYEVELAQYHFMRVEQLWKEEDRNGPIWDEYQALLEAFFQEDSEVFKSWINLKFQTSDSVVSWCCKDATTVKPIHIAAAFGLTSLVKRLVEHYGQDPSATNDFGWNALHLATWARAFAKDEITLDLIRYLLEKGVDPNADSELEIALHCAVFWENGVDVIDTFLKHGADATKTQYRRSALHWLADYSHDIDVLHSLLKAGADINATDSAGGTPLHRLMSLPEPSLELLDAFLEAGADVNVEDDFSRRPLFEAAMQGNTEAGKRLIDHGADIHDDDIHKATALHVAADFGRTEVVWLLIDSGADPTLTDARGRTPFYLACSNKSEETALSMLERLDSRYFTVFSTPIRNGKSPLRKAAARGHAKVVDALLAKIDITTDVSLQDKSTGQTPLHAAAFYGHRAVVESLIKAGSPVDIKDKVGDKPVRLCLNGWQTSRVTEYEDTCIALIEKEPLVAKEDAELLNGAALRGSTRIIERLLALGADPMQRDEHGWTSLQIARQYGQSQAADILAKHQAVVGLRPSRFRSSFPTMVAASNDGTDVKDLGSGNGRYCLLSDHPIPALVMTYYYEITVSQQHPGYTGIPLTHRPERLDRWLPGWPRSDVGRNTSVSSWAYHGDDGGLYSHIPFSASGANSSTEDKDSEICAAPYGPGDTVGCGIDFRRGLHRGIMFFTRNGDLVHAPREGNREGRNGFRVYENVGGRLYPAVSVRGANLTVNLGANVTQKPFQWAPANEVEIPNWEDLEEAAWAKKLSEEEKLKSRQDLEGQ